VFAKPEGKGKPKNILDTVIDDITSKGAQEVLDLGEESDALQESKGVSKSEYKSVSKPTEEVEPKSTTTKVVEEKLEDTTPNVQVTEEGIQEGDQAAIDFFVSNEEGI